MATPKSFTLGNDQMHLSLLSLNQDFISEEEDLKPGRLGLYEQTSSRPKGLLVEFYATELRLFDAIELRLFDAIELRLFDAIELRVFMRRGRGNSDE